MTAGELIGISKLLSTNDHRFMIQTKLTPCKRNVWPHGLRLTVLFKVLDSALLYSTWPITMI